MRRELLDARPLRPGLGRERDSDFDFGSVDRAFSFDAWDFGASSESFRSTSRLECPVNFEKSREETDSVFFSVSDKGNSGFIRAWRISSLTPARFARWIKVWIWEAVVTFIRPSFSASAISGEVVKARIAWTRR